VNASEKGMPLVGLSHAHGLPCAAPWQAGRLQSKTCGHWQNGAV